jgi:NAD(P)-dependent dehydrogenase (short-subunit alcohol dehydrogenase family)
MDTSNHPPLRLAGKTAIVTGACGGIGQQIVRVFAREGATIIASDLADPASDAAKATIAIAPDVTYRQLDISSEQQVAAFFESLAGRVSAVDVLVNNAGIILGKPLRDTSVEEWDRLVAVNGRGTFLMMRGVLACLNKAEGSIVNVSSGAAIRPMKNLAAYGASKAAVNALTKAAALELAPIRVNVVCPGVIDTPLPRKFTERLDDAAKTKVFDDFAVQRALGRIGLPEEIANVVLFLASSEASYVTGAEFNVDGGKL